jgi:malate dehydrogenase (oxaloacetate-decarboxylating)
VVVLAALINALKIVRKEIGGIRVVISGAGAAGIACARILLSSGVGDLVICDRKGAIHAGRTENMNPIKEWAANNTNARRITGDIGAALQDADVFMGVSTPGAVTVEQLRGMAKDPVIFALANPTPEVPPEDISEFAAVVATGRSDYPNQINNVMCFPGIFRGALRCQARDINEEMKLAAARAIANTIRQDELNPDCIVPSVFDKRVGRDVAEAVAKAATETGVARATEAEAFTPSKGTA